MLALGCRCCQPFNFDPVPQQSAQATSHRPSRRGAGRAVGGGVVFESQTGSAGGSVVSTLLGPSAVSSSNVFNRAATDVDDTVKRRQVIARGLSRFEMEAALPPQADWEQLSQRVLCILGQNASSYTLNGTNCYLVGTGRSRVLIDAGEEFVGAEAFMDSLAKCMEEFGVDGLDAIVITHMHHDHYGNIGRLQERYGPVPVYTREMSENNFPLLQTLRQNGQLEYLLGSDGMPAFNPKSSLSPRTLPQDLDLSWVADAVLSFPGANVGERLQYLFFFVWHSANLVEKLRRGDYPWQPLQEGSIICTEGATLSALYTPGHSSDHMSFLLQEEHSLFSGDHVLGWGTTLITDMQDYMSSLHRMLDLQPVRLYPGHGAYIEDGVEILVRYIAHRESRERQAWEALARSPRPVSIMDVAKLLYPDTPKDRLWMAKDNVESLFRKFVADGSAAAFALMGPEPGGEERFEPVNIDKDVKRVPKGLLWAAKRSVASKL
ncbi:unnamed protein product [Polarella glacialis]|uniref:Metallo-beta-lactamase domain-containing protein n=1 Tax=Polarella glacialis TaxID=89957 RepID=A0A813J398_POLGL|nr:unnamed protein product [Polarella glacialis]